MAVDFSVGVSGPGGAGPGTGDEISGTVDFGGWRPANVTLLAAIDVGHQVTITLQARATSSSATGDSANVAASERDPDGESNVATAYLLVGTPEPTIEGDVDGDCDVDILDIMLVARRWGTRQGDAMYNRHYDLDADGDIDILDIMLVATHWGGHC